MLRDVIDVRYMGGHRLWVAFDDGVAGEVDFRLRLTFTGVFEPLQNPTYFAKAQVDADAGTVAWPNEANVDPIVLYSWLTNRDVESILSEQDVRR